MKNFRFLALLGLVASLATSCGGSDFEKEPLDVLIQDMNAEKDFTIILYDMDVEGTVSETFKHQYQIIRIGADSVPTDTVTEWVEVSEEFFLANQENMGMEIASKTDGTLSKEVAPAGFSHYVGNPQYGQWSNQGGSSVWTFFASYMMFSTMLNMATMPIHANHYNDYHRNYRGTGRAYYGSGPDGKAAFGSSSARVADTRGNSRWVSNTNNQNFRGRVQERTSRSTSRQGTSTRSRGGGYGK